MSERGPAVGPESDVVDDINKSVQAPGVMERLARWKPLRPALLGLGLFLTSQESGQAEERAQLPIMRFEHKKQRPVVEFHAADKMVVSLAEARELFKSEKLSPNDLGILGEVVIDQMKRAVSEAKSSPLPEENRQDIGIFIEPEKAESSGFDLRLGRLAAGEKINVGVDASLLQLCRGDAQTEPGGEIPVEAKQRVLKYLCRLMADDKITTGNATAYIAALGRYKNIMFISPKSDRGLSQVQVLRQHRGEAEDGEIPFEFNAEETLDPGNQDIDYRHRIDELVMKIAKSNPDSDGSSRLVTTGGLGLLEGLKDPECRRVDLFLDHPESPAVRTLTAAALQKSLAKQTAVFSCGSDRALRDHYAGVNEEIAPEPKTPDGIFNVTK